MAAGQRGIEPDPRGPEGGAGNAYPPVPIRGETWPFEPDPRGRAGGSGRLIPLFTDAPRRGGLSPTPQPSGVGPRGKQRPELVVARKVAWLCRDRPASRDWHAEESWLARRALSARFRHSAVDVSDAPNASTRTHLGVADEWR